jgi:hypothetical protein
MLNQLGFNLGDILVRHPTLLHYVFLDVVAQTFSFANSISNPNLCDERIALATNVTAAVLVPQQIMHT